MKRLLLLPLLIVLTSCQSTSFELAPLPDLACDQALVGRWYSQDENRDKPPELELRINNQCWLEVDDLHQGKKRSGEPTQLHIGRSGRHAYLWVDASWAGQRFDDDHASTEPDIYVMRYKVEGDTLALQDSDDEAIAHAIIDGKIPGDVQSTGNTLHNRITGGPHPQVLDLPGFFERTRIRFQRAEPESRP